MKSDVRSIRVRLSFYRTATPDVVAFIDTIPPAQLAATLTQLVTLGAKDVMRYNAAQARARKANASAAPRSTGEQRPAAACPAEANSAASAGEVQPSQGPQFTRFLDDLVTFSNRQNGGLS